jgi:deoxyribodipyrimidine photo-lyase
MKFETAFENIINQVNQIDPKKYAATRNFINGRVTYLSPYISRGVISLPTIAQVVMAKGLKHHEVEKFIQELAWREYFQRVWQAKGDLVSTELKNPQHPINHYKIPNAINEGNTGVEGIDKSIRQLKQYGYMHNHVRMYTAGLTCNIAQAHWLQPARWMYYYLLDADWASNALSWQWVAGAFSSKKYIANQENVNKYTLTNQTNTFLDISYEAIASMDVPNVMQPANHIELKTNLPITQTPIINKSLPTCVYNLYNLDPLWMKDIEANRVLLLEPSLFEKYPVGDNTLNFILALASNINGVQIVVDSFSNLENLCGEIFYKEHPLNEHYNGLVTQREWMFPEGTGYHSSFTSYWKKCERYFKQW